MKNNILTISILVILVATASFFMWKGDRVIRYETASGFSLVSFENTKQTINPESADLAALKFKIENKETMKNEYRISIKINNREVLTTSKEIPKEEIESFTANQEVIDWLAQSGKKEFIYEVEVSWEGKSEKKEKIYKKIHL